MREQGGAARRKVAASERADPAPCSRPPPWPRRVHRRYLYHGLTLPPPDTPHRPDQRLSHLSGTATHGTRGEGPGWRRVGARDQAGRLPDARSGWYGGYGPAGTGYNPVGIIVLVLIVLLIIGLVGGPGLGWCTW